MTEPNKRLSFVALAAVGLVLAGRALAADSIQGQVLGAGAPVSNSTVTLYAAGAGAPKQVAQTQSGTDGQFTLNGVGAAVKADVLYVIAKGGRSAADKSSGDNPGIALMSVLGNGAPAKVTVNEMTTVASVWTNAQFLDGSTLKGHALGLKIASGNVPNFVDLATGGWGEAIQGPLNSSQTPTMANFATLADVLAGCVTRVTADACSKLFAASNFAGAQSPIVELCGTRTQNCPPGMKTGDQISPPGGYVGGGLQMLTDIAVDPAGNVWAMNNWQDIDACIGTPAEGLSTRCGGQGVVIFYGMAKPVRAPQIGPARAF